MGSFLVLAPIGRDAAIIAGILGRTGAQVRIMTSLAALCEALHGPRLVDVAGLFIAEETLSSATATLAKCLADQPPWSDLPVVVLTTAGARRGTERRWSLFEQLGNVTLLGRPLHSEVLLSAGRAVLRARERQHEARRHLEALQLSAETLEARVEQRTRELMEAEEALRQAQKMEAVGQLTGGLAHDFNNMLTGVTGSLELLRMRLAQGRHEDLDRHAVSALAAAERAATLTHRLLAFSRRQTLDPRPISANRLIAGMEELIRRTVGPSIALRVVLAADECPTLCDPHQLESAVLNLCINARDAMPEGGRLVIRTEETWVDEHAARLRDIAPGGYIAISVTDTGSGMPPEVAARAFDPFFTTKPIGQGTGLGLSMTYGFVRQSGGDVGIHSAPGRGTSVTLSLPCHDGEVAEAISPAEAPEAEPVARGVTVLVVDDEKPIRALLRDLLQEAGCTVIEAEEAGTGLRILRSAQPIELLISDVGLPGGMNGRQMVDAARQLRPELKVIFITGYAEQAALGPGIMEPNTQLLTEPFRLDAVMARVRAMLASS